MLSVTKSEEIPSINTKGLFPPTMEVLPRTRTLVSIAKRSAPPFPTLTPAIRPEIVPIGLFTKPRLR